MVECNTLPFLRTIVDVNTHKRNVWCLFIRLPKHRYNVSQYSEFANQHWNSLPKIAPTFLLTIHIPHGPIYEHNISSFHNKLERDFQISKHHLISQREN